MCLPAAVADLFCHEIEVKAESRIFSGDFVLLCYICVLYHSTSSLPSLFLPGIRWNPGLDCGQCCTRWVGFTHPFTFILEW